MITKIEKLKNIGNFEDYTASGDLTLNKLSVVYANNGAGKTTLARVFHSLSTNDPDVVLRHKRINGTGNPEVTIKNETPSPFVFSGTKWNRPCPEIEVFDAHFVINNVYSGFEINSDHHKSLYQFVVGSSGVAIVNKIERVKNMIAACNGERSTIAGQIINETKYNDADKICSLQPKDKVDEMISEKEKELKLAQGQQQIAAQKAPGEINVTAPAFSAATAQRVLETTVEGIGAAYLEEVKAHLDGMFRAGMNRCSDWVYGGVELLKTKREKHNDNTCPFCGQSVDGIELVKGYNLYFSQEYRTALKNARDLLTQVEQINIESYLVRLKGQYQQIETAHKFWKTLLAEQPDVPAFDIEALQLGEKYKALKDVVDAKAANPVAAVNMDALNTFKEALEVVNSMCVLVNAYVKDYVAKITELRSKIRPVADVEKELKELKIYKARYEEPLMGYCKKYDTINHQLARLQRINKQLQADQKAASAALFQQYGQKTNYYLRDVFATPFQIADVKDVFKGSSKKPNLDYTLTFNGVPILQGDDGMSNYSFKNVLSEGDKNTIAFSFFLAKLTSDPDLANKIVVFDDPLSSLDQNRRKATIHELMKLYKKCQQLIVLSHNLQFLVEMTGRNETAKRLTKVVRIAKNGNSAGIELFELRQEWMDKFKRSLLKMEAFVAHPEPGVPQEEAISGIRLTLELLLKLKYCKYHNDQNGTFGELIDLLESKPECEFINPNKDEVISNLRKLNEAAWKPHHAEVGERDAFQDEDMTTDEAVAYTQLALRMLQKEI